MTLIHSFMPCKKHVSKMSFLINVLYLFYTCMNTYDSNLACHHSFNVFFYYMVCYKQSDVAYTSNWVLDLLILESFEHRITVCMLMICMNHFKIKTNF